MPDTGSTVPRRQLGRYLRRLREDARVTVKGAADALEWSTPKVWRIESGAVAMRSLDVAAMCQVYRAPAEVTRELMDLAGRTRARGWWRSYGAAVPEWFELYLGLESAARRLRVYQPEVIPDLLRTRAYAERLHRRSAPGSGEPEIDRRVALLLRRQALLGRAAPVAPRVEVVLSEAALCRALADRTAWIEQLRHLVEVAESPDVSVQVLPLRVGPHRAAASGPFVILDFPPEPDGRDGEPPVVYVDGLTGGQYLDKPTEVIAYLEVWRDLRAACLDEAASVGLVAATMAQRVAGPAR